eukprot:CAMPEP_0206380588 /NCGR_PEP_ID=MMETSP0294-20121207/12114_1 /ASSEMBLY_ACC=CAM_ASM_000327 /TAXON_ID=39354 /ORGANISM="Heterosigma akashiwo, Strain CCMP2393" /LENGTH=442 /DNA_ID=CAMNT_0053829827 /DNA_START=116 /DNA_END=1444 /DNA_ORIENTATION=+
MKGLFLVAAAMLLQACHGFQFTSISVLKPAHFSPSRVPMKAALESFDPVTPFLIPQTDISFHSDILTGVINGLSEASDVAAEAAKVDDGGWLAPIVSMTEAAITTLADITGSDGVAIIAFTLFIKALTYPLTKTQLESTTKMQAIAPKVKQLQSKYANNPELANQKIAELYQTNEVNPLAGCIPALVQIPVFISLYRALLNLAAENRLNQPFLWIPSLEGPTFGAPPTEANAWLFKGWVDGVPSLGWTDTLLYLTIPVILVISQYISTQIMQPKDLSPEQEQSQAILKVLPLMIGWFSINVPAGLGIYWVANNIITTALTVFIRGQVAAEMGTDAPASSAAGFEPPKPQAPLGFGGGGGGAAAAPPAPKPAAPPAVAPPTIVDAEVVEAEVVVAEAAPAAAPAAAAPREEPAGFSAPAPAQSGDAPPNKGSKKGGKKKKKRN